MGVDSSAGALAPTSSKSLFAGLDRDGIIRRLGRYEQLCGAPRVPDFDGNYLAFTNWVEELTETEKHLAIARSTVDKLYFIDNWVWFESIPMPGMWPPGMAPAAGLRQFKTWDAQAWAAIEADQWNLLMVIKVRQWGATWMELAKCDQELNFQEHQNQALLSLDLPRAQDNLGRLRLIHDHLPGWMKTPYHGKPSKGFIALKGDSRIKAFATQEYGAVSGAYSRVYVDELALIESERGMDLTELIDQGVLEPLRMMQGRFSATTTGRARAGYTWHTTHYLHKDLGGNQKAKPEVWSDMLLLFVPASWHPVWCDPVVYAREMKRQRDPQKFRREHPRTILEAFSPSGICAFDPDAMERRFQAIQTRVDPHLNMKYPPPRATHFEIDRKWGTVVARPAVEGDAEALVYVRPKSGHRYICCADPSRGGSGTKSWCAAHVVDVETGEQVCVVRYKFKTGPAFARYLERVCRHYNLAMLGWERNVDEGGIKQLLDDNYPNLIYQPKPILNSPLDDVGDAAGYLMTEKSRGLYISELKEEIIGDWLIIYDRQTIEECSTFVTVVTNQKTGAEKERASSGANDDLVMSLAATVHFCREAPNMVWVDPEEPSYSTGFPTQIGDVGEILLPSEPQDLYSWPETPVASEPAPRNFWEQME